MNEQLQQLIADTFDLPPAEVTETLARDEVDHWDSLNHLRLITAVEETFGLKLTMSDIESVDSIGRLLELLASHGRH